MRRSRSLILLIIMALAGSVAVTTESAYASLLSPHVQVVVKAGAELPGGRRPVVAQDTGWVPTPTYFRAGAGACGGITSGGSPSDYGTREKRVVTFRNGDAVTLLRGSVTLSVGEQYDWIGDPLPQPRVDVPISGAAVRVDYASGAFFLHQRARTIVLASIGSPEAIALGAAGLNGFYYLEKGAVTSYVRAGLARGEPALLLLPRSARLTEVCDLIGYPEWANRPVLVYDSVGLGGRRAGNG